MPAFLVLCVFVPDQISWAFNYDPRVLWGEGAGQDRPLSQGEKEGAVSARIASGVHRLLNQIAYRENARLQLNLSNAAQPSSPDNKILVTPKVEVNEDNIKAVTRWLNNPDIHPLNCGVYALRDLLATQKVVTSLDELSLATLSIDLLNDIVRPGEPKLKTSLYSIEQVMQGYGLKFKAVKVEPADVLKLKAPFIASYQSEHFVTVKAIDQKNVYFTDIGKIVSLPKEKFAEELSGYVLVADSAAPSQVAVEEITDTAKAFVWGNTWVDNSEDLWGIDEDVWDVVLKLVILIIQIVICVFTWVGCVMLVANVLLDAYVTMLQVCVMEARCTAEEAEEKAQIAQTIVLIISIALMAYSIANAGTTTGSGTEAGEAAAMEAIDLPTEASAATVGGEAGGAATGAAGTTVAATEAGAWTALDFEGYANIYGYEAAVEAFSETATTTVQAAETTL